MKKILVPTDFSKNASDAILVGAQMAKAFEAKLVLLHVNTTSAYALTMSEYYTIDMLNAEKYAQASYERLFAQRDELLSNPAYKGLDIKTYVESGFIHGTVNKLVEEEDIDLVVMGTKGASGLDGFIFGSNTERVIRTSHCPILIIPEGAKSFGPQRIVFASTLQDNQLSAFRFLSKLQKRLDFEVDILYLNNPGNAQTSAEIKAMMSDLASKSALHHTDVFTVGNVFDEEKAIQTFAKKMNADCIAMATHQRKGLARLLFGSLTEDSANHSKIPILSIPIHDLG